MRPYSAVGSTARVQIQISGAFTVLPVQTACMDLIFVCPYELVAICYCLISDLSFVVLTLLICSCGPIFTGLIPVNCKTALITCFYGILISAFMRGQSTFRYHRCSRRKFQYFSLLSIEIDLLKFHMGHNVNNLRMPNHQKEDNENLISIELIQHLEEIYTERCIITYQQQTEAYNQLLFTNPSRIHEWPVSYEAFDSWSVCAHRIFVLIRWYNNVEDGLVVWEQFCISNYLTNMM